MAKESQTATAPPKPAPPAPKRRQFGAPQSIPEQFHVQKETEFFIDGYVETRDVRELLDEFGLHDRTHIAFPFQHIRKRNGEIWVMFITDAMHVDAPAFSGNYHHWTYKREVPETVAGVA